MGTPAGKTRSTRCRARSAIRRPPQDGQKARPPQVKGTSRWWSHAAQCRSAKPSVPNHPHQGPQRANAASSRRTKPGTVRPWASAASTRRGSRPRTTRRSRAPPGVAGGPRCSTVQAGAGGRRGTRRTVARNVPNRISGVCGATRVSVVTSFDRPSPPIVGVGVQWQQPLPGHPRLPPPGGCPRRWTVNAEGHPVATRAVHEARHSGETVAAARQQRGGPLGAHGAFCSPSTSPLNRSRTPSSQRS